CAVFRPKCDDDDFEWWPCKRCSPEFPVLKEDGRCRKAGVLYEEKSKFDIADSGFYPPSFVDFGNGTILHTCQQLPHKMSISGEVLDPWPPTKKTSTTSSTAAAGKQNKTNLLFENHESDKNNFAASTELEVDQETGQLQIMLEQTPTIQQQKEPPPKCGPFLKTLNFTDILHAPFGVVKISFRFWTLFWDRPSFIYVKINGENVIARESGRICELFDNMHSFYDSLGNGFEYLLEDAPQGTLVCFTNFTIGAFYHLEDGYEKFNFTDVIDYKYLPAKIRPGGKSNVASAAGAGSQGGSNTST
ncbi:unnamed protein product, partial [Amoebophrya sp. A120]